VAEDDLAGYSQCLVLRPDCGAEPCIWLIEGSSQVLWIHAPLSDELRRALDRWRELWEEDYYYGDIEGWATRDVYDPWVEEGRHLMAVANRELMPLGYVVVPGFLGFPRESRVKRDRARRRQQARLARSPTVRQRKKIVADSNVVLRKYGESVIPPQIVPVALAKRHRRSTGPD
jgi:hypothetical protein